MEYTKPQVVIDLDEYEMLKASYEKESEIVSKRPSALNDINTELVIQTILLRVVQFGSDQLKENLRLDQISFHAPSGFSITPNSPANVKFMLGTKYRYDYDPNKANNSSHNS